MSERVRGSVINVHALGAAVRLEDGRLVSVPLVDVNKNRASYTRALGTKTTLPFDLDGRSVRLATTRVDEPIVPTATTTVVEDPGFEAQIAAYLMQPSPGRRPTGRLRSSGICLESVHGPSIFEATRRRSAKEA